MQKVLLIDNYDSFTYNLVELLRQTGCRVEVMKNDRVDDAAVSVHDAIILSPGPGLPADAGITREIIQKYHTTKKMLGVCLGHQAIAEVFGARLKQLPQPMHGEKTLARSVAEDALLEGLPESFAIGHYHSWVVASEKLPEDLVVISRDESQEIMALRHRIYNVWGVQFHPESIMTSEGKRIIANFLEM